MKKRLLSSTVCCVQVILFLILAAVRSYGQSPVVVSWSFASGGSNPPIDAPTITGASNSVVALNAYLGLFGSPTTGNGLSYSSYGVELFGYGISGPTLPGPHPNWPTAPTDNPEWYIEFPVSPAPGYNLTIDSMSNINLHAENLPNIASVVQLAYALDGSTSFTLLGSPITDPYATTVISRIPAINVTCPAGHTLRFRLYTYGASSMAPSRTLDVSGVVFMGSTTSNVAVPSVAIAPDTQAVCSGARTAAISFSGSTISNTVYHWTNSDTTIGLPASGTGNIASFTAISHRSTNDTAVITITPIAGTDSGTAKKAIIVIKPLPVISLSADTTICAGSTALLTASGAGSFSWAPAATLSAATGSSVTATPRTTTTYTVTGTANGCTDSNTVVVAVTASPQDTLIVSAPGVICSGSTLLLQTITDTAYTYQWLLNGIAINNAASPQYNASIAGTYSVRVASAGCIAASRSVQVDSVHLAISLSADTTICFGTAAPLTASGAGSFTWVPHVTFTVATGASVIATPRTSTIYTVTAMANGCTDSSTVTVAVVAAPKDTLTVFPPGVICSGSTLLLGTTIDAAYTYQWLLNGNAINNAVSALYNAVVAGMYSVQVSSAAGCATTTHSVQVDSVHLPIPVITKMGTQICAGTYASYKWYFNGQLITGQTNSCITPGQEGAYTVTVTDSAGCSATSAPYQYASAVPTVVAQQVRLYPNPAVTTLYIDAPKPVNISLNSLDGKQILFVKNARTVDISALPAAIYMVKIYDGDAIIKIEKLVKTSR